MCLPRVCSTSCHRALPPTSERTLSETLKLHTCGEGERGRGRGGEGREGERGGRGRGREGGETDIKLDIYHITAIRTALEPTRPSGRTDIPEKGPVKQELEDERRGYLIGKIGHTNVKERQIRLQHITDYNL